jgi:DNA-directed RNA polymerase beta subunit
MSVSEFERDIPPFVPPGMDVEWTEEVAETLTKGFSSLAFKAYLKTNRIGSYHIKSYEESIMMIYEKVRALEISLDVEEKLKITFENPQLEASTVLPIECRTRSLHYTGKLTATPVLTDYTSGSPVRRPSPVRTSLCDLPIMVRSKYCRLHSLYKDYEQANDALMKLRQETATLVKNAEKTGAPTQKIHDEGQKNATSAQRAFMNASKKLNDAGADPADPGCYFIMDGVPRIILLTEKLRLNIPYVYMESGSTTLSLSMWSPRPITSILRIVGENVTHKNDDEKLYTTIYLQNSIFELAHGVNGQLNIFFIFRILGIRSRDDVIRILQRIYPTYDDPHRTVIFETMVTLCTKTLTDCYDNTELTEENFFDFIYKRVFKKHILKMYPMTAISRELADSQFSEAAVPVGEMEDDVGEMEFGEYTHEQVKAWCQKVVCLNIGSHLHLAGERQSENQNWFDESDREFIQVYHPQFEREVHARVYLVAILLVKYCLTRIGEIRPANRDSWENKRILTTGERFLTQFHHSFFRAVQWDKTAKKISVTVAEMARYFWDSRDDETKRSIRSGRTPINVILDQIKIKSSFTWSTARPTDEMTEEERAQAEKLVFEKLDRKNNVCDLACRHDSDIIVPIVLEDYWNAFKKRCWGVRGMDSYWEPNVTDTLNINQSDLHTYNQLCQIVVRTNDQSKNIQPRLVQESQMYFVCPVVTPEGPTVGNTKQIAVGTIISDSRIRRDDLRQFIEYLSRPNAPRLYRSWVSDAPLCRLLYYGSFIGLCDGEQMRDFLMEIRGRELGVLRQSCIAFDELFQLNVTTEGSRLMRPVFRLNKETGLPLFLEDPAKYIKRAYLTENDWKEMESKGYIHYIDAWEQMSGFYMVTGGKPSFIRSINDVPMSQRRREDVHKPFPVGFLIAGSIWDLYSTRDRLRFSDFKGRYLRRILPKLASEPDSFFELVKESMVTLAYGASLKIRDEELSKAREVLYELSQSLIESLGDSPLFKVGQGKLTLDIFPDVIRAMTVAKTGFNRDTPVSRIRELVDEYIRLDIQGLDKVLADLSIRSRYTHVEINPAMLYSAVALDIPYLSHIHGPRANLASKFNQQAIRGPHTNHDILMPGEVKILERPEIPLVVTSTSGFTGLANHPAGQNVIVAVACFEGENQEDSLIFNKRSLDSGMFNYTRYYTEILSKDSEETGIFGSEMYHRGTAKKGELKFGRNRMIHKNDARFRHISDRGGLPKPGWFLNPRDCIIAAYEGDDIDRSVYVKEDGAGYVDRVTVTRNFAGNPVVKVRVKQVLTPVVGDKFASRHAQKCTIGRIVDAEDMPFVEGTGLRPDIIMNPHALPSRQTVGQVLEMVASKVALLQGERIVADVFEKPTIENMVKVLRQYGYDQSGTEVLIDPKTKLPYSAKVLVGPCYYQALKHQVKFKIQSREGYGAVDTITGQPIGGRQVKGGTREGTMETAILNISDSMALHQCKVSDPYPIRVCEECGGYVSSRAMSPEGVCHEAACVYCKNSNRTRYAKIQTIFDLNREGFAEEVVRLLMENFTSSEQVMELEGITTMVIEFENKLREFATTNLFAPEALRRAWFSQAPNPDYNPTDESTERQVSEFTGIARDFWKTLVERVTLSNRALYRENVSPSTIRPILDLKWKTTIIPQSSMVFFRYINQMGYRTRFKFTQTASALPQLIPAETERAVIEAVNAYIETAGPVERIRIPDLVGHIQEKFPDININRGTPMFNTIQGHLKQFLP